MTTIVAAATVPGRAALALVRLSGPDAARVRDAVCRPLVDGPWRGGRARRVELRDATGPFDDGVAVWTTRGYTGEPAL
ncbi:MAG: hypothetical protein KC656_04905, partial [Myxococcales bacterium]|nr:hypothetical protein [Myxococcales bacterium]